MATLGDTSEPTNTAEAWSAAENNFAMLLTMPAGGPWLITHVAVWAAGYLSSTLATNVLWHASGSVLNQSAEYSMAQGTFSPSGSNLHNKALLSGGTVVSGGQQVYVGFSIPANEAAFFGRRATGSHFEDDDVYVANIAGGSNHNVGAMGAYLTYESANAVPNAPTLNSPIGGTIVASQTPTLNFTPSDPNGDAHVYYEYQVDNNSDFSSPLEYLQVGPGSFTNGVAINDPVDATLSRGTTYYWRARTHDGTGWGPWSAGQSFKIGSLPDGVLTAPGSAQAAELYFTAGSAGNPKIKARWTFSCPDGHAQDRAIIRIYADTAGSPGSLLNTDTYNGSGTSFDTTYAVTEGTYYHVSVEVRCTLQLSDAESTKHRCRTRWARGSYYFDSGSTPLTLSAAADVLSAGNQTIVIEYATTGSSSEPSTWYSTVAAAGKNRFFWHRVTMFAWGSSPTTPTVRSLTWTYSANALTLDHWNMASGASVDEGTFVYGTQSLKHLTNGAEQISWQNFAVNQNTEIILQIRVKTQGDPNAEIRIMDSGGGTTLVQRDVPADTDWMTYVTVPYNTAAASTLRCALVTNAANGAASAWFDAGKAEQSTVATPWQPGFIGAVKMDAGGLIIDGQRGGIFRLKSIFGGTTISLGDEGLETVAVSPTTYIWKSRDDGDTTDRFIIDTGGQMEWGGGSSARDVRLDRAAANTLRIASGDMLRFGSSALPSTAAADDLYYLTDVGSMVVYDGTRWLGLPRRSLAFGSDLLNGVVPLTVTGNIGYALMPDVELASDWWLASWSLAIHVNAGQALGSSHKWTVNLASGDSGAGITSYVKDSGTLGVWTYVTVSIAALLSSFDANSKLVYINATKTGTPAGLWVVGHLNCYPVYT